MGCRAHQGVESETLCAVQVSLAIPFYVEYSLPCLLNSASWMAVYLADGMAVYLAAVHCLTTLPAGPQAELTVLWKLCQSIIMMLVFAHSLCKPVCLSYMLLCNEWETLSPISMQAFSVFVYRAGTINSLFSAISIGMTAFVLPSLAFNWYYRTEEARKDCPIRIPW